MIEVQCPRDVGHGKIVLEAHPKDDTVPGLERLHHLVDEPLRAIAGPRAVDVSVRAREVSRRDGGEIFAAFR